MLEIFFFINNNVKKKSAKFSTLTWIAHNSFIFKDFWLILVQDMRNDIQSKNLFYLCVLDHLYWQEKFRKWHNSSQTRRNLSTPLPPNIAREKISSYINTITLIPRQNFKCLSFQLFSRKIRENGIAFWPNKVETPLNKQNYRIWLQKIQEWLLTSFYIPLVFVWWDFWSEVVIGTYFFVNEAGNAVIMNRLHYGDILTISFGLNIGLIAKKISRSNNFQLFTLNCINNVV